MSEWTRVNRANRCPVCNHDTWCCVTKDGAAALCMRAPSDYPKQLRSGETGWIHKLTDAPAVFVPLARKPAETPKLDCAPMLAKWQDKTKPEWVEEFADYLGVSALSLTQLGVCWAAEYRAWAFPMKDGGGSVVGIRLRDEKGGKFAVKGSKQGLFMPNTTPLATAYIVEGPTDCAAGLTLGLYTIGRPSCSGGVFELKAGIPRLGIKQLVVVSDNDGPGLAGARALTEVIPLPACVCTLPTKDLRGFVQSGGTAEVLNCITREMRWVNAGTTG